MVETKNRLMHAVFFAMRQTLSGLAQELRRGLREKQKWARRRGPTRPLMKVVFCAAVVTMVAGCASGEAETPAVCGNGACEDGENRSNCPADCLTAYCGNDLCEQGEDTLNCPEDCATGPYCGDGNCDPGEDTVSCPQDCSSRPVCGNGICEDDETADDCPADCSESSVCGDDVCEGDENADNCPDDCAGNPFCGDGECNGDEDENSCPTDCAEPPVCGDDICEGTEDETNCPQDCDNGSVCGNNICEADEDHTSCPADCEPPPVCGDGVCEGSENETNCPDDCNNCVHQTCDLVPQCGCPSGEKCTVVGAQRSCLSAGSLSEGSVCVQDEDCVAQTICSGFPDMELMCYRFCSNDSHCAGAGSLCVYEISDGQGGSVPDAMMCSIDCSPVSNAGCPATAACDLYSRSTDGAVLTDCGRPAGTSTFYCDGTTTFCAPGYFCDTAYNECTEYCRVGSFDCPASMYCYSFSPAAWIGSVEYGYCWY